MCAHRAGVLRWLLDVSKAAVNILLLWKEHFQAVNYNSQGPKLPRKSHPRYIRIWVLKQSPETISRAVLNAGLSQQTCSTQVHWCQPALWLRLESPELILSHVYFQWFEDVSFPFKDTKNLITVWQEKSFLPVCCCHPKCPACRWPEGLPSPSWCLWWGPQQSCTSSSGREGRWMSAQRASV